MHSVRVRRRSYVDLRRITLGDIIVLVAGFLTCVSLFMPWFVTTIGQSRSQWAFAESPVASALTMLLFLVTLFLVIYPALTADVGLPTLPFSTPLVFLTIGIFQLLMFDYEFGKYGCIQCQNVSRGFGVWIALVASFVYIVGAVIKWGSRPIRRH